MAALFRRLIWGLTICLLGCAGLRMLAIFCRLPWFIHDPLIYFPTLFYAVPGLMSVAILFRRKAIRPQFLVVALAVIGINVAADLRLPRWRPAELPAGRVVQLLSYNIFQARWGDEDILALVRERRPNILFLQEVPQRFFDAHEQELRQLFRHVEYHNQLLAATDLEVVGAECIWMSQWRSLLHLELQVEGNRLDVYNTHLSVANPKNFFSRLRAQQQQTDELLRHLAAVPGPLLVAGDFNFPPHSTCYQRITATYANARAAVGSWFGYTFNTFLSVTTIDHCFASETVQFLSWEPLPVRLSDHRPVVVRFVLPAVK